MMMSSSNRFALLQIDFDEEDEAPTSSSSASTMSSSPVHKYRRRNKKKNSTLRNEYNAPLNMANSRRVVAAQVKDEPASSSSPDGY
jgi:hypothetical protein